MPNFAENDDMPGKNVQSQAKKKKTSGRKKPGLIKFLAIILTIVVLSAFLFFNFYTPGKKAKPESPSIASDTGVPFRKEGTVTIFRSQDSPLNLDVEIADQEEERMQGLMYRYSMKENQGMFFIFPYEEPRSFWMKNTFISLDIIYINKYFEIVSIQKYTQPKSTYSLPSEKPAQYVLEVVAGYTDNYNVGPGDKVELRK